MLQVLIIGAGGHGQVVADILLRMGEAGRPLQPVGYVDDDPALAGAVRLGLPVLGATADLERIPCDAVIVAIGQNAIRARFFSTLAEDQRPVATAIHPSAVLAPDVIVGPGTVVCAGVVVNPGARIGANVILNTGCTVDHHCVVGDHAHIAPGVHMGGEVVVGEGALVGIGATVLPGCTVGAWSVVGAAALVHRDLSAHCLAYGVPAVVRKRGRAN